MSLNRLFWDRIIRNKISQYRIDFNWLSLFFEFNTITIAWNYSMNRLWKMSMFNSTRVFLHSSIHTKSRCHFLFFCQLNLHRTISTILLFSFNDSRSSRTRHVKKSWRLIDYCFIQASFDSSRHHWKLWCFKLFFFSTLFSDEVDQSWSQIDLCQQLSKFFYRTSASDV